MTSLSSHLASNPRGREYTYAVRFRGLPYLWTDGRATWSALGGREVIVGGLAKTDWAFDFKADPREPLDVGGGITIQLLDEPSRRTRYMFSPEKKGATSFLRETFGDGVAPDDTSLVMDDGSVFSEGQDIFIGLETVTASSIATNTVTSVRGAYDSPALRHVSRESSDTAYRGVEATSYPTTHAGRYVDVYMAPIQADGSAGDRWTIWAGRVGSFKMTGRTIRVSVDPLNAAFVKDEWPLPLPGGTTGSDDFRLFLRREDLNMLVAAAETGVDVAYGAGEFVQLGYYNTAGTFTPVPDPGGDVRDGSWFTLEQLAVFMTDTLVESSYNASGGFAYLYNNVALSVVAQDDKLHLVYRNDTAINFYISLTTGFTGKLAAMADPRPHVRLTIGHNSTGTLLSFHQNGWSLDAAMEGTLRYIPTTLTEIPYPILYGSYNDVEDEMWGYAKVSDGENIEVVAYSATAVDSQGTVNLALEQRNMFGTKRRNWGSSDELQKINVEAVNVVATGLPMDAADVLLYLLLSIDGATGLNGTYDRLGCYVGLGLPEDMVDIDGIKNKMRLGDMPKPNAFWAEVNKGKTSLSEFMKAHGVYFVTKRFTRNSQELFGLSVDLVDVPVETQFTSRLTDSHVTADTCPDVDINERTLINVIKITPRYEFDKDSGDLGGVRYAYAEDSISKYGRSKTLEISANVWFNMYSSLYGGTYNDENQVTAAIATHVGIRWFGAFADGNYTATLECPHIGWAFQSGDRIRISTTGGVSPDGNDGLDGVAKVTECKHNHGSRAGAQLVLRLNTTRASELTPCLEVTSVASNVITVAANSFTDGVGIPPFPDQTGVARDIHWFDLEQHNDGNTLHLEIWEEGNYTNRATYSVGSVDLSANTLSLTAPVDAGLTAVLGSNVRLLATMRPFGENETVLSNQYCHVGSSATKSLLGEGTSVEQEAYEWV